jgi:hypothetical protein
MFDQDELKTASLSGLGAMLLDAADEAVRNDEVEEIEQAYKGIGLEVVSRVPDPEKLRHLMDFHYKKWADLTVKGTNNFAEETDLNNSYLELRALMTGFVEVHAAEEVED